MGLHDEMHIWYNPNALVNILSLSLVLKSHRVVMDIVVDKAIKVEWRKREWRIFKEIHTWLCIYNTNSTKLKPNYSSYSLFQQCTLEKHKETYPATNINEATLVQTIEENTSNFTADEVRRSNMAKNLCGRIRSPST